MAKADIKQLLALTPQQQQVEVLGWVRNRRGSKQVAFITLNDGSTARNIQVVVDLNQIPEEALKDVHTGAALRISGRLVPSQGSEQAVEVMATSVEVLGPAQPEEYPLQPKKHSLEFIRENAHLRARTATFGAVFRLRHYISYAIHQFFHEQGFFYVHTPIITASDAEGAGAMFRVTTLDMDNPPRNEEGKVDFCQDFFERPTNLTVSGQLEAELLALGLGKVYTFGPTFRAENSNTTRHLAEFWMIEPEAAFYDIHDNMDLAESFVKYVIRYVLEHCTEDLSFLEKRLLDEEKNKKQEERSPMPLIEKLQFVVDNAFERLSYSEAIDILLHSKAHKKNQFQFPVSWGIDLQAEHERYLVEKHFKKPVILTDYPKAIKAFYMKQNDDGKTVRAMDVLFPGIGEIIGGSQREDEHDKLLQRMQEVGISPADMWWYLDIRRFGSVPHSGFGLGLERFVQFITGMGNIRDVIPFPRTPGNANF